MFNDMFEEVLEQLGGGWHTDGFGMDSLLVCPNDGTQIEIDCPECPECGERNPLHKLGIV